MKKILLLESKNSYFCTLARAWLEYYTKKQREVIEISTASYKRDFTEIPKAVVTILTTEVLSLSPKEDFSIADFTETELDEYSLSFDYILTNISLQSKIETFLFTEGETDYNSIEEVSSLMCSLEDYIFSFTNEFLIV